MVRGKEAEISSLVYVVVSLLLCFAGVPPEQVGIYEGCTVIGRLAYPFFHASFLHWAVNAWAMLCIVFYYRTPAWSLPLCYGIAVSFPASLFGCTVPTVGASGIIYALLGLQSFRVRNKIYWQGWWAAFLALGFLFTKANGWLHLYCYLCGVLLGFLNTPFEWKRK